MKIFFTIWMLLLCLLGNQLIAQTTLSGVITDLKNTPIPYASVYFSKTTIGVITNDQGKYSLTIPQDGTYELICSCVGFETHSQIIKVDGFSKKLNIQLPEKIILIDEVAVNGKSKSRKKNYNLFLKCFIGQTRHSLLCKIQNPEDLIVYRKSNDSNLIAYSVKPLIIKNGSFGYVIKYDLLHFNYNLKTNRLRFAGNYYFQDITNQNKKNERIERDRLIAYYGSRMHFLRALFTDSISKENFRIYDTQRDSTGDLVLMPENLPESKLRVTWNTDSMTLYHQTPIAVYYKNRHQELYPDPYVFYSGDFSSVILFNDTIRVYKNGYYSEPYNLTWGGSMANDRVAELLPFDFVPHPFGKVVPEKKLLIQYH